MAQSHLFIRPSGLVHRGEPWREGHGRAAVEVMLKRSQRIKKHRGTNTQLRVSGDGQI